MKYELTPELMRAIDRLTGEAMQMTCSTVPALAKQCARVEESVDDVRKMLMRAPVIHPTPSPEPGDSIDGGWE